MTKRNRLATSDGWDNSTTYIVAKPKGDDRRRFDRWSVNVPVRELEPEVHVLRASSVSAGGFYCPEALPRLAGEEITVEVDVGRGESVVARARVVHSGRSDGIGVGLEFVAPMPELVAAIAGATA